MKSARTTPTRRTGETRYPRWGAEVGTLDIYNSQLPDSVVRASLVGAR